MAIAAPPPAMAAPQTVHSYTFVPSAAGASDLGGYFRLGGYSELESNAADIAAFYPRLHGTDVAGSVGGAQGIVLTCTGRMLIRAGEALYVHSVGAMSIDTVSTLAITADDAITVNSLATISITTAEEQSITIDAGGGTGDITQVAAKSTKSVFGEEWDYVTKDKHEYLEASTHKIQLGTENKIHLGGKFTIWMGASITFNVAIDFVFTAMTNFLFYLLKFEVGMFKFEYVVFKGEWKAGKWLFTNTWVKAKVAKTETAAVSSEIVATESENEVLETGVTGAQAITGGTESEITTVSTEVAIRSQN